MSEDKFRFAVFAWGDVGLAAVKLFRENKDALRLVILDRKNFWDRNDLIIEELNNQQIEWYYEDKLEDIDFFRQCQLDLVILGWWGRLIKEPLLNIPKYGFLNLHTSYLPYGKGKHPHCWSIIDQTQYGVTMHFIEKTLDTGPIVFQKEIPITWEDTGRTLYFKGIKAICELLEEKKQDILNLNLPVTKQLVNIGTSHYSKDLEQVSLLNLEQEYKLRDLLNVLRAKTFSPFPAAFFFEDGKKYEVRIQINEVKNDYSPDKVNYRHLECL